MDGLVSIGKKFPYTIIKIIFSNIKDFVNYFINILFLHVDKGTVFLRILFLPYEPSQNKKYYAGMFYKNRYACEGL